MKFGNHSKIALSWILFATLGISGFFMARSYVHNNRFNEMKVRANIKQRLEEESKTSPQ